jgi:hypothetical protein
MIFLNSQIIACFIGLQCLDEIGTIVGMPHPTVMRVQYDDARIWSIVRAVLQRVRKAFVVVNHAI